MIHKQNTQYQSEAERILILGSINALSVIVEDACEGLLNIPDPKSRQYIKAALNSMNRPRMRDRRTLKELYGSTRRYTQVQAAFGDIADAAEGHLNRTKAVLRDILVKHIKWQDVEKAVLYAVAGGTMRYIMAWNRRLTGGKSGSDYMEALAYLRHAEQLTDLQPLDDTKDLPDFSEAMQAVDAMAEAVAKAVAPVINGKQTITNQ